jgi:hypothetical protein
VLNGLAQAIPAGLSGLEIPGSETFDEELLDALGELKEAGYQLALDGVDEDSLPEPALALFDIVKLDVPRLGPERLRGLVARLREATEGTRCRILAQGIATEDRDLCVDAGCDPPPMALAPSPVLSRALEPAVEQAPAARGPLARFLAAVARLFGR